jgi:hypothetical protein
MLRLEHQGEDPRTLRAYRGLPTATSRRKGLNWGLTLGSNGARRSMGRAAIERVGAYFSNYKPSYFQRMTFPSPIRRTVHGITIPLIPLLMMAVSCGGLLLRAQTPQAQAAKPSPAVPLSPQSGLSGTTASATKPQLSVDYAAGKLSVTASNASLNQILSEVSHKIGMKITGGVTDERVFGQYGPSSPATVLNALLDGTGSNMLLVDDAKGPTELILTPRLGGPTPPSPTAAREQAEEEQAAEPPREAPERPHPPMTPRRGIGRPTTQFPPPPQADATTSPNQENSGTPPDGTPSPNGTKTPQQIYNELRQMQQQQALPAPQ